MSVMVRSRTAALFYIFWVAELVFLCNGAVVHDADIIFASATTPKRYKIYGDINFVARGPGVRALWMLPGMEAAAEVRKQHSNRNETFAPGEFPSAYHAMPGDFIWVSRL